MSTLTTRRARYDSDDLIDIVSTDTPDISYRTSGYVVAASIMSVIFLAVITPLFFIIFFTFGVFFASVVTGFLILALASGDETLVRWVEQRRRERTPGVIARIPVSAALAVLETTIFSSDMVSTLDADDLLRYGDPLCDQWLIAYEKTQGIVALTQRKAESYGPGSTILDEYEARMDYLDSLIGVHDDNV